MLYIFLIVGFIILWMAIGTILSLSRATNPHVSFTLFMVETVLWPVILYLLGWQACVEFVTDLLSTLRVN